MRKKQTIYPRESSAILEVLREQELSCEELFSRAKVSPFIGMTLMQGLLSEKTIAYRVVDGIQMFRILK